MNWSLTDILHLASDQQVIRSARTMAQLEKWREMGSGMPYIWGTFANKSKPYRVSIDLTHPTTHCNCGSRKHPCVHAISLLLLWSEEREAFTTTVSPEWYAPASPSSSLQPSNLEANPSPTLLAGLHELKLWLQDLVRNGFNTLEDKPKGYWAQMADRLVDARAYQLAQTVRQFVRIPKQSDDWPRHLLPAISRLYMLIQGFEQFSQLPPPTQADLIAAVDWHLHTPTPISPTIHDSWLVLGRQGLQIGGHYVQQIWLWGQQQQQYAHIYQISRDQRTRDLSFVVGTAVTADLIYLPSNTPLTARLIKQHDRTHPTHLRGGYNDIPTARQQAQTKFSQNPWWPQTPMLFQAMQTHYHNDTWFVRDQTGYALPLPNDEKIGWPLLALSNGRFIPLFGLWDGVTFTPLSLWAQNRVHFLYA